jgi:hypothetical protein
MLKLRAEDCFVRLAHHQRTAIVRQFVGQILCVASANDLGAGIVSEQPGREGILTGRGADFLIIDDRLKALSETERQNVNNWFDHTLLTRLNDKREGRIIVIMQRLHEDDLVGHLLGDEGWRVLRFPAIADCDEDYTIRNALGCPVTFRRRVGDLLIQNVKIGPHWTP